MLTLLIIAISIWIGWEDLCHRAVAWYLFPLLLGFILADAYQQKQLWTGYILANTGILFIHLILLNLWSLQVKSQWLMAGESLIGWGDILFFSILVFCFSPVNFMLFHTASLLTVLTVSLLVQRGGRTVPLAGGQALLLATVVLSEKAWGVPARYSDAYWLIFLNP